MKKIINGKKYDTTTATFITEYWNGKSHSDVRRYDEELYKKKTGEFFLYGFGGPGSKYATSIGTGGYSRGEAIVPLTLEEAKEWVEENANDEYEKIFGEVEE